MFKWLKPIPPLPPRPLPADYVPPACWVVGCTGEGLARLDMDVSGLPRDARVCEDHDLPLTFNIANPEIAGLSPHAADVAVGDEEAGWVVGGFFLVRPVTFKASPEPCRQRPDLP